MKKLRNFFLYALLMLAALMLFTPKVNLYYQAEQLLKPYEVVISGEEVRDSGFWLDISDATLYVKQIESAEAKHVKIKLFGLYNALSVDGVMLSSAVAQFLPQEIEQINVRYSIIDPLHVHLDAVGDFGTATATVSIMERKMRALIEPSKIMTSRFAHTLRTLKKDEAGGYVYESRF